MAWADRVKATPDGLRQDFERRTRGELPEGWRDAIAAARKEFLAGDKELATRQASGAVLNHLFDAAQQSSKEESKARSPLAEERPAIERQRPAPQEDQHPAEAKTREKPSKSFLRRHPVASALGAILAAAAMGAGYTYFDYTQHFQSTDDAVIAARQTALAPKVAGYVTQVAVTDNEHVPAGGVIARIDDRDYRIALEQAKAQVAAAEASIRNIDAQTAVQDAQVKANQAQVDQVQAALTFCEAAGGPLRGPGQEGLGHHSECPAIWLPAFAAGGGPQER